jgi:hypothetical protein
MRIVFVDARSSADWRSFARFVVKTIRAVLRRAILRSTTQRGEFGLDAPLKIQMQSITCLHICFCNMNVTPLKSV